MWYDMLLIWFLFFLSLSSHLYFILPVFVMNKRTYYNATCILHNVFQFVFIVFFCLLDFMMNMHAGTTDLEVRKFVASKLNISQKKKKLVTAHHR